MDRPSKLGAAIAVLAALHLITFFLLNESPVWANASFFLAGQIEPVIGPLPRLLVAFIFTILGLAIAAAIAEQESRLAAAMFLAISMFEAWARLGQLDIALDQNASPSGMLLLGLAISFVALVIAFAAMWTTMRRT